MGHCLKLPSIFIITFGVGIMSRRKLRTGQSSGLCSSHREGVPCLDCRLTDWVNCHVASSEVLSLSALVCPRETASIHGSYIISELSVHVKLTLPAWQGCFRTLSHVEERDTCQESGDRELLLGSTTLKSWYLNPADTHTLAHYVKTAHILKALRVRTARVPPHTARPFSRYSSSFLVFVIIVCSYSTSILPSLFFCRFIFKILMHLC